VRLQQSVGVFFPGLERRTFLELAVIAAPAILLFGELLLLAKFAVIIRDRLYAVFVLGGQLLGLGGLGDKIKTQLDFVLTRRSLIDSLIKEQDPRLVIFARVELGQGHQLLR